MKNKKILTGLLLTAVVVGGIGATTFANDSTNSGTTNTVRGYGKMNNLTAEQKIEMTAIKVIMQKKKNGETLTTDEQAKLTAFEANRPAGMGMGMLMGKGQGGRGGEIGERGFENNLTDAEKTALTTMTDSEKQTFFETKMTEQKAKMITHENVIDKLLAGQTLTPSEETTKQEIIKERADRKIEMQKRQADMAEIKTILEKKKAGTTLTSDEQAKLDASRLEGHGKGMRGMRK
ncbi:MAG: hypothetical protein WC850_02840 [Candidatus Gracilibacteria bacterium]